MFELKPCSAPNKYSGTLISFWVEISYTPDKERETVRERERDTQIHEDRGNRGVMETYRDRERYV